MSCRGAHHRRRRTYVPPSWERSADTVGRRSGHLNLFMRQAPSRPPLLFFDLETTGLSGGAATYAFLVGCGWFDAGGAFVTRQYMRCRCRRRTAVLTWPPTFRVPAASSASTASRSTRRCSKCAVPTIVCHGPARVVPHSISSSGAPVLGPQPARERRLLAGASEQRQLRAARDRDVPGFEIPARYFNSCARVTPRCSRTCSSTTGGICSRWRA